MRLDDLFNRQRHAARNDIARRRNVVVKRHVVQARLVAQVSHHEFVCLVEDAVVQVGAGHLRGGKHIVDELGDFAQGEVSYRHAVHEDFVIRAVIVVVVGGEDFGRVAGHETTAAGGDYQLVKT